MIKCLRARRGNVHPKQNCFRGVLLFKTHFVEFCVKYVCKTEPWNWAVTAKSPSCTRKYIQLGMGRVEDRKKDIITVLL